MSIKSYISLCKRSRRAGKRKRITTIWRTKFVVWKCVLKTCKRTKKRTSWVRRRSKISLKFKRSDWKERLNKWDNIEMTKSDSMRHWGITTSIWTIIKLKYKAKWVIYASRTRSRWLQIKTWSVKLHKNNRQIKECVLNLQTPNAKFRK